MAGARRGAQTFGRLGLTHRASPAAGKALKPCLALWDPVGCGYPKRSGVTTDLSELTDGLEGILEKPSVGGDLSQAEIPEGKEGRLEPAKRTGPGEL